MAQSCGSKAGHRARATFLLNAVMRSAAFLRPSKLSSTRECVISASCLFHRTCCCCSSCCFHPYNCCCCCLLMVLLSFLLLLRKLLAGGGGGGGDGSNVKLMVWLSFLWLASLLASVMLLFCYRWCHCMIVEAMYSGIDVDDTFRSSFSFSLLSFSP